jgi:hypothetical protein
MEADIQAVKTSAEAAKIAAQTAAMAAEKAAKVASDASVNAAVVNINIEYIKKDITEIKDTLKIQSASYVARTEHEDLLKVTNSHDGRIFSLENSKTSITILLSVGAGLLS